MHSNIYLFYESLKKVNPKLVFITEVDDILFNDSKENNRFLMEFYLLMPVIVSNGYIANYLFNIIPHIKLYLFQTKLLALEEYPKYKPPKNPVILHAGTNTHSKDLSLIVEPLKNVLLNHPNTKVCFWGNGTPLELEKYHNQTSRKQYTSDYEIYTQAFLQFEATFSINPLIVSRINTGKSAIKYLEAAQKGLPALFSPIPEYLDNVPISELIVKDEEWENKMEWMLSLTKKQLKEISNTMRNDFLNKWVFTQQDIEDYYNILIESKNLTFGA
jgi:glycosyltransferase involved in cell wall biosynthesis